MTETGDIHVFELQELPNELSLAAKVNDLFAMAKDYFKEQSKRSAAQAAWEFGISVNLKPAISNARQHKREGIDGAIADLRSIWKTSRAVQR